jgi:hypothetical protein
MSIGPNQATRTFPLIAGAPPTYQSGATTFPWWKQYEAGLCGWYGWPARITAASLAELDGSSDDIHASIPHLTNAAGWRAINYRHTGVVVGAIQSGKTRSMVAIAAKAFDRGFPIVLVLSGLKNDLREQTARRFHTDLLQHGEAIEDPSGTVIGYTHPSGPGFHGTRRDVWANPSSRDAHEVGSLSAQIVGALSKCETVLLVVKKQKDALRAVQQALDAAWQFMSPARPPLFVLDDECDEASVPGTPRARLPVLITNLWLNAAPTQPVAYVGFTATPQANVFQNPTNPLFPRVVHALRTPSDCNSPITYYESGHPTQWYSGTDVFYEWLEQQGVNNFLIRPNVTPQEVDSQVPWRRSQLSQAIIAYCVSGAIRLAMSGKMLGTPPFDAPAHSMLIHTDLQKDAHWQMAEAVCEICRPSALPARILRTMQANNRIDSAWMSSWLGTQPNDWKHWYDDFQQGFSQLQVLYSNQWRQQAFPTWAAVSALLPHVFANVKLKVVNSDTDADTLDFSRIVDASGVAQQPEDVFTIVVGGNVLSRGLTIEGLCTSYFTRWPNVPLDDTTMQRQRWLGYRGSHIEFCRVFSLQAILDGLRRASNADVSSRQQLSYFAAAGIGNIKASYLLFQGAGKPSGKMGTGRALDPTYTGAKPFVRFVQQQTMAGGLCPIGSSNEREAYAITSRTKTQGVPHFNTDGSVAGYVLKNITALEVADLLDKWEYESHNPDVSSPWVQAFDNIERLYHIPAGTLHRRPASTRATGYSISETYDPYLIAAYLRLWHYAALAVRSEPNRFLGSDLRPWQPCPAPSFNIVYRCGSKQPPAGSLFTDPLTDKIIDSDGTLRASWGRSGTLDEEWFDLGGPPPPGPASPRSNGQPGLLMVYVIHRHNLHPMQCHEAPTCGVVVPLGGPSLRATAGI